MRVRATKLDEYQFLTCVKHNVWGSKSARFDDWKRGDLLVLLVGNFMAGYAEVTGEPYRSDVPVWDDGLYPHRLPMRFVHVSTPEHRVPVLGRVRDTFAAAYTSQWGLGLKNQWLMSEQAAAQLVQAISATPNDLQEITTNMEQYLAEARSERPALKREDVTEKRNGEPPTKKSDTPANDKRAKEQDSDSANEDHSRAQHALVQLGLAVGCSVWVASNDRNRTYRGARLGDGCLTALPNLGLNEQTARLIGFIDVIWIKRNTPLCAFEVEATTSVYSGLLRMSDLVELVPALKMKLYIVGPRTRQAKVVRELGRPTFQRIGLNDVCKFIATEDLEPLVVHARAFAGHIVPTVVETVAVAAAEPD